MSHYRSYRERAYDTMLEREDKQNNMLKEKVRKLEAENEQLKHQLAEAQRCCQDMETKLHNECQAHARTKAENKGGGGKNV